MSLYRSVTLYRENMTLEANEDGNPSAAICRFSDSKNGIIIATKSRKLENTHRLDEVSKNVAGFC